MDYIDENNRLDVLTTTEVSNVWSDYLKSSMESRFFEYFLATTNDPEIKQVVKNMYHIAIESLHKLKEIFTNNHLPIPVGFTDKDIDVKAQKLFSDTFTLYFC